MNIKPLVSVIIPVYNHENYVQSAIKSIINQTYENIEIIIIDDGSKDFSFQKILELKEECENRFVNTIIETKENEGTCKTYNKLISKCNGEFIYIIASDDIANPTAIEKEAEFLVQNPEYVLAVGNNEMIDSNNVVTYRNKDGEVVYDKNEAEFTTSTEIMQPIKKIKFNSDDFGSYSTLFFVGNYIPNGYLVRKSALEKCGEFTPEAPLEDYWEMMQLSKFGKFKYFDEILFSYRIHETNTSTQGKKMRQMGRKTIKNELKILKSTDFSTVLPEVKKTYIAYKFFGKLAKFAKKLELAIKYKI